MSMLYFVLRMNFASTIREHHLFGAYLAFLVGISIIHFVGLNYIYYSGVFLSTYSNYGYLRFFYILVMIFFSLSTFE